LSVAGFVSALSGALFGLMYVVWIAFPLGLLGLIFGAIAWQRVRSDPSRGGKGLAISAVILGAIALVLAILGAQVSE
jgi:hypothetical protein